VRLLLDTNIFVWCIINPKRLSTKARRAIDDPRNERVLSYVSVWEIITKATIGKLNIAHAPADIKQRCDEVGIDELLPIHLNHIYHLRSLPPAHSDPFDRLLIAQAQVEGLRMVTSDTIISDHYLKNVIW
jgi:PIN domain nuclease of toxin-antitoxin system